MSKMRTIRLPFRFVLKWYSRHSWLLFHGGHIASWFQLRNRNHDARFKLTVGHLRVEWW